jgi:hypothetical protein
MPAREQYEHRWAARSQLRQRLGARVVRRVRIVDDEKHRFLRGGGQQQPAHGAHHLVAPERQGQRFHVARGGHLRQHGLGMFTDGLCRVGQFAEQWLHQVGRDAVGPGPVAGLQRAHLPAQTPRFFGDTAAESGFAHPCRRAHHRATRTAREAGAQPPQDAHQFHGTADETRRGAFQARHAFAVQRLGRRTGAHAQGLL